jgi:hypothetical protein
MRRPDFRLAASRRPRTASNAGCLHLSKVAHGKVAHGKGSEENAKLDVRVVRVDAVSGAIERKEGSDCCPINLRSAKGVGPSSISRPLLAMGRTS